MVQTPNDGPVGARATLPPSSGLPLIATSLAPKNLERQKAAVSSWVAQGFNVVSINVPEEMELLTPVFPEVTFRPASRDARSIAGKPLVPLDDVLRILREENRRLSGIVNSDIVLTSTGGRPLAEVLRSSVADGMTFIKRMDQENENEPGARYDGGIDAFFFGPQVLFAYPATPFYLGLPWWDYFFAVHPVLAGLPVTELRRPVALHLIHSTFFDLTKHWIPLATDTIGLLLPLLEKRQDLVESSGMSQALTGIWNLSPTGAQQPSVDSMREAFDRLARAILQVISAGSSLYVDVDDERSSRRSVSLRRYARASHSPLRIGIPLVVDDFRIGSAERIGHLARAISQLPSRERPHTSLVVLGSSAGAPPIEDSLRPLVNEVIVSGDLDEVFQRIDFLLPAHLWPLPGRPAATAIPDLQHRWLPTLLPRHLRRSRDAACQVVAEEAELLVLTSQAALGDWQLFYRDSRPAVRVIPPRVAEDEGWFALDPHAVAARYGIDEPFLICCNRFWVHSDHATIVDAISSLSRSGEIPLVVWTGSLCDESMPGYVDFLRAGIDRAGLSNRIRLLGTLPRADQMALVRASLGVIEASLYRGWSTVVEEAKVLGKTVVMSDRLEEQASRRSHLFRNHDPSDLARTLLAVLPDLAPGPSVDEEIAREEGRQLAMSYARAMVALANESLVEVASSDDPRNRAQDGARPV